MGFVPTSISSCASDSTFRSTIVCIINLYKNKNANNNKNNVGVGEGEECRYGFSQSSINFKIYIVVLRTC